MFSPSENKEYVHIAGDKLSAASEFMTAKGKSFELVYKGKYLRPNMLEEIITCELYDELGEPWIHTICVRCGNFLRVKMGNKKFSWDEQRGLFIDEKIKCPWLLDGTRKTEFGIDLCNTVVAYDGKVIKDA